MGENYTLITYKLVREIKYKLLRKIGYFYASEKNVFNARNIKYI